MPREAGMAINLPRWADAAFTRDQEHGGQNVGDAVHRLPWPLHTPPAALPRPLLLVPTHWTAGPLLASAPALPSLPIPAACPAAPQGFD